MTQAYTPISHAKIWAITGPIILSNATVPLVGIVDTAVMGRYTDPAYIAGVALGAATVSFALLVFGFLRVVTGGFAAQAFGSANWPEFKAVYLRSLVLALGLGLGIAALSPLIIWGAEAFFTEAALTETLMSRYLQIRLLSAPFTMINMVIIAMLVAEQRTGLMFGIQLFLNILNIVLNLIFVLGFDWGVSGLALASVTAEACAMIIGLLVLQRRMKPISIQGFEVWSWAKFKPLLSANGNIIIRNLALDACFLMMVKYANPLGTAVVAANAIHIHFINFAAYALDGFAFSVETLCGAAYGRKNRAEFRDVVIKTCLWAAGISFIFGAGYWLFGAYYINLMTVSTEVREVAMHTLLLAALGPVIGVWAFQADGIFFGTTRTAELRNATVASAIIFNLMVWVLWPWALTGLWLSFLAFFLARALFLFAYYPSLERRMG